MAGLLASTPGSPMKLNKAHCVAVGKVGTRLIVVAFAVDVAGIVQFSIVPNRDVLVAISAWGV